MRIPAPNGNTCGKSRSLIRFSLCKGRFRISIATLRAIPPSFSLTDRDACNRLLHRASLFQPCNPRSMPCSRNLPSNLRRLPVFLDMRQAFALAALGLCQRDGHDLCSADRSVGVQTMPRGAIWAGWRRAQAEAYATLLEALDQGHSFSWLAKPASTGFLSM